MIVWHVTTAKKLFKYKETGFIKPPVRGWKTIQAAERFSKQTGRSLILRLKFRGKVNVMEGHRGEGVYALSPVEFHDM